MNRVERSEIVTVDPFEVIKELEQVIADAKLNPVPLQVVEDLYGDVYYEK